MHVEQITADRQVYAPAPGLRLPRDVRDVSIDYTALSFVAPEKIRFRYILEGQDPDWKEVVNDRRAHYSNLPPGRYRFRVVASNNSGVWNEDGARRAVRDRAGVLRNTVVSGGLRRSDRGARSGPLTGCASGTWCGS